MASTNKTSNLGLNVWVESDKPKRVDFVADNSIIDNVLGGHINNTDVHLTNDEKSFVTEPFKVITAYGTGEASLQINAGFSPSMVAVFKKDAPPAVYTQSVNKINSAVATPGGGSGGISVAGTTITLTQSSGAVDGVFYNLNEAYAAYIVIAFR